MNFAGTVQIKASLEKVWSHITDCERLGSSIPNVTSVKRLDDTHFELGVEVVLTTISVEMEYREISSMTRLVIDAKERSLAGDMDMTASTELTATDPTTTTCHYVIDYQGSRLFDVPEERVKELTSEALERMKRVLEP